MIHNKKSKEGFTHHYFSMRKNSDGFTLIELLVVIAIIGILSSVVLASLNTARQKSRDARRLSDIGQLELAFELYFDSCRQYPVAAVGSLVPLAGESTGCSGTTQWSTFMTNNPDDPTTGVQYGYSVNASGLYCVGALLEDTTHPNAANECSVAAGTYNHTVAP